MSMTHFGRYDRQLIYYRARPARRTSIGLAILFLLSLAAVATFTTARAQPNGSLSPDTHQVAARAT